VKTPTNRTALAIKSCHKYAERRKALYDTWLKDVDTDFFFLLGAAPNGAPDCDGIPDALYSSAVTSDAFADIAPKILLAVEYALEDNVANLCVCDDDSYICWPRMKDSGFEKFDYLGFVRNYGHVPYMQGSCYCLSERAMEEIVRRSSIMRCGIPDDVAVGHCLNRAVPYTHEHRFQVSDPYPEPQQWPRKDNDIIAVHKLNTLQMRECHSSLSK
jgi:hypothetical protein